MKQWDHWPPTVDDHMLFTRWIISSQTEQQISPWKDSFFWMYCFIIQRAVIQLSQPDGKSFPVAPPGMRREIKPTRWSYPMCVCERSQWFSLNPKCASRDLLVDEVFFTLSPLMQLSFSCIVTLCNELLLYSQFLKSFIPEQHIHHPNCGKLHADIRRVLGSGLFFGMKPFV